MIASQDGIPISIGTGNTRKEIEAKTGKKVVSKLNAKQITGRKPENKLK